LRNKLTPFPNLRNRCTERVQLRLSRKDAKPAKKNILLFSPNLASFAPLRESSFVRLPKRKFKEKFQICLVSFLLLLSMCKSCLGDASYLMQGLFNFGFCRSWQVGRDGRDLCCKTGI